MATTRAHLSGNFLYSAFLFANMATEIEKNATASEEHRLKHTPLVISSVLSSAAFIEACVNELFVICAEHPDDIHVKGHPTDARFRNIGDVAIVHIGALWSIESFERNAKPLEKCETALRLAGKAPLPRGENPYQDAQLLIQLRNILVHFKPEEREVAFGDDKVLPSDDLAKKYQNKLPPNALAAKYFAIGGPDGPPPPADYPFFPPNVWARGARSGLSVRPCVSWTTSSPV